MTRIGRFQLFGGPPRLLALTQTIADDPRQPDVLHCSLGDYRAAGLHLNGPSTYIAVLPPPDLKPFNPKNPPIYRQVELTPGDGCPHGELWAFRR
jgi:hypothetical protein